MWWRKRRDRDPAALAGRDVELTNELLTAAREIYELADEDDDETAEQLAFSLLTGHFWLARRLLPGLAAAAGRSSDEDAFREHLDLLREKVPRKDLRRAETIARAVGDLLASEAGDPFELQQRLTGLLRVPGNPVARCSEKRPSAARRPPYAPRRP